MIQYDSLGNELRVLPAIGGSTLIDTRPQLINLAAVNAEIVIDISHENTASFDIRGTWAGNIVAEVSVDGTNFLQINIWNRVAEQFTNVILSNGVYTLFLQGAPKSLRLRMSAYTSGAAMVAFRASQNISHVYALPIPASLAFSSLTTVNSAATITLPAVSNAYHYITKIEIIRINTSASAIVAAAILNITTGNFPNSIAWQAGNGIAGFATIKDVDNNYITPIKSANIGTATTINLPAAGAGVQFRINVHYYVA